jgi:hypothetical protein
MLRLRNGASELCHYFELQENVKGLSFSAIFWARSYIEVTECAGE